MFNHSLFENSRLDGRVGVLEIPGQPEAGELQQFVPLKKTEITGAVIGPLASLVVTHSYRYTKEQCAKTLEALYRFPLPGDAAVTGVKVTFGEVEINAVLKDRQAAESDYTEAKQQGRQAALLTRESPDVFTLQVAGLRPDEEIVIETRYVQLARQEGAGWSLRLPLTTSPRYVRADESRSPHSRGNPLAVARDPGHRFALDVLIAEASALNSVTHGLAVADEDGWSRVRLQEGSVAPDRDCVLSWRLRQDGRAPTLHVLTHRDEKAAQTYFLAMIAPPAQPEVNRSVPREAIVLVDHSGSMEGAKWSAADWTVQKFLSDLDSKDLLSLGLFHNDTRWLASDPQRADARTLEKARHFLLDNRDSGGTELGVALEQALRLKRDDAERARHVLVITDAEVTDESRILRLVEGEQARPGHRRRVSVLCIDAAPNSFLVHQIVERGGGTARFLTSEPGEGDITTTLDEILADWSQPVFANLKLMVNRPNLRVAGKNSLPCTTSGWSAADLGDLPAGRAIWVAGMVPEDAASDLQFQISTTQGPAVATASVPAAGRQNCLQVKALFGAWRLLGLEFLAASGRSTKQELSEELTRLGYDPTTDLAVGSGQPATVYAENAVDISAKALSALRVRESLNYGLLTSATGFVAVRSEAGTLVEETAIVANALPAGWSPAFAQSAGFPSAMPAPMMAPGTSGAVFADLAAPAPSHPIRWDVEHNVVEERMDYTGLARPAEGEPDIPSSRQAKQPRKRRHLFEGLLPAIKADRPTVPIQPTSGVTAGDIGDSVKLFAGEITWQGGAAILFDTESFVASGGFSRLRVRFPDGAPDAKGVGAGLVLFVFVGDLSEPLIRVRLADLIRQNGERPVNLPDLTGKRVRVVLQDDAVGSPSALGRFEVELGR